MGKFEEYQENKKQYMPETHMQATEEKKGLDVTDFFGGYDAEQLQEHINERMENSTFEERTAYYFQNTGMIEAKARRYRALSNEGEDGDIENLASKYTYRSADKRKKRAREASKAFGKAAAAARKLERSKNLTASALYGKREEIMRLRMEGMLKAAEVKAQSAEHEQYLKSKAKLSCLSILMDQLEEMQKEAKSQMEDAEERKLSAKHRSLSKELEAVRAEVERTLPPIEQTWEMEHGITDEAAERKAAQENKNPGAVKISAEAAKTMMIVKELQDKEMSVAFPMQVVRYDRHGLPMNKTEGEKLWSNGIYLDKEVVQGNQDNTKKEREKARADEQTMVLEALARVEKFKVPDPDSLNDKDPEETMKLFQKHAAEYYEMLVLAPKYLNDEMAKEESTVQQYAKEHPSFASKVKVLSALSAYFNTAFHMQGVNMQNGEKWTERESATLSENKESLKDAYFGYKELRSFDSVKKREPDIELLVTIRRSDEMRANPVYQAMTQQENLKREDENKNLPKEQQKPLLDHSRNLSLLMKPVHFNKYGKPATKLDIKNHQHNMKWLNSWIRDSKEDREYREDLISNELPHFYDWLDQYGLPEPDHLVEWIEERLKTEPETFMELQLKAIGIGDIAKISPYAADYLKGNDEFVKKDKFAAKITNLIPTILLAKHKIADASIPSEARALLPDEEGIIEDAEERLQLLVDDYKNAYEEYKKGQKKP